MRTDNIYSAIIRELRKDNLIDVHSPYDIYREMNAAQCEIFALTQPQKEKTIVLNQGQSIYPLRSGWNSGLNIFSGANAASIENEAEATTGITVTGGTLAADDDPYPTGNGDYSVKYTFGSYRDGNIVIPFSPGSSQYLYFEFYAKADRNCDIAVFCSLADVPETDIISFTLTANTWTKCSGYFFVNNSADAFRLYTSFTVAGSALWLDDFTFLNVTADLASRKCITEIKSITCPAAWGYQLRYVTPETFNKMEMVDPSSKYPVIFSIFDDVLKVWGKPAKGNEIIKLQCELIYPETDINETTEIELAPLYDAEILNYSLSKLLVERANKFYELFLLGMDNKKNKGKVSFTGRTHIEGVW